MVMQRLGAFERRGEASLPLDGYIKLYTAHLAGRDDGGDGSVDEALPAGVENYDCDGDGFTGSVETHVYEGSTVADQDPCGTNGAPANPPTPIGWPADLVGGGIPDSTNKVNVYDITSFIGSTPRLNTNVGTRPGTSGGISYLGGGRSTST